MKKILGTLAILMLALVLPSGARACTGGQTTVDLTLNNVNLSGLHVILCIDANTPSSGLWKVTLESVSGVPAGYGDFQKIFSLAWNGSATWSSGPTGWINDCNDFDPPLCGGFDGFGKWNHSSMNSGTPFSGLGSMFIFSGDPGTEFSAHIGFTNGCTFVASTQNSNNAGTETTSDGGLSGACTNVPEPGTMALFGAGLLGLAALRRRLS